jgi:hypothetical protein
MALSHGSDVRAHVRERIPRRLEAIHPGDPRGLNGFGEGHRRQDGGEPPSQHGDARPRGANEEDVGGTTPASDFASPEPLGMSLAPLLNLRVRLPHQYGALS